MNLTDTKAFIAKSNELLTDVPLITYIHPEATGPNVLEYEASSVGLVLITAAGEKFVISKVNGSICANPLGKAADATCFDDYLEEWLMVLQPAEEPDGGLAFFAHDICGYKIPTV